MTKELYDKKRAELIAQAQGLIDEGKIEDAQKINTEIEALDEKYENACKTQANLNALNKNGSSPIMQNILGGKTAMDGNIPVSKADMLNSTEYRTAFMMNVLKGEKIPEKFTNAAAQTTTGEVTSVIPTVLIQKIYSKLENYGKFYAMFTKTGYKGGVTIPTADINLIASWVAERGTADTQEAKTGSVTFAYHKLICKVAISFEVDTITLDIFESEVVEKISKAMVKAIEQAAFTGLGSASNQPEGILTKAAPEGQEIFITEGNHITYADLAAAEAALPEEYEQGAIWAMTKKTFYSEIVGMVDEQGQPIARVSIGLDGKPEHNVLGRKVEFCAYMPNFATSVTADTTPAIIYNFGDYVVNTNAAITLKKYTDEDTDDVIRKATALIDGKPVDINSLVKLTIKNS